MVRRRMAADEMPDDVPQELELGEVLEFMRVLWALDHALNTVSKHMSDELGITGPQRLCIRILGRYPNLSPGQLAEIMHVHPSTLTGVLKRLEQKGIVARRIDPNDARRSLLTLTPRGKGLDRQRSGTVEEAVRRTLSRTGRRKVEAAGSVVTALTDALLAEASR